MGLNSFILPVVGTWALPTVFLQADWLESDPQRAALPLEEFESRGGNQAACLVRFPRSSVSAPSRGATWQGQSARQRARRDRPSGGARHYRASARERIRCGRAGGWVPHVVTARSNFMGLIVGGVGSHVQLIPRLPCRLLSLRAYK